MSSDQTMPEPSEQPLDDLRRRLEALERENARLRHRVEPLIGRDNPCFDRAAFGRAMRFYMILLMVPVMSLSAAAPLFPQMMKLGVIPRVQLGPVTFMDLAGIGTNHPGIGVGLIAFGGLGVGVLAFGGLGVGLIAIGGGALGILAIGGGAVGVFAIGGGACGYIALGGNAVGRYALGINARGKWVFAMNRQDPEAVSLFTRLMPRLKAAVTTPMPVIPLESKG
jgi:hypothetical protein